MSHKKSLFGNKCATKYVSLCSRSSSISATNVWYVMGNMINTKSAEMFCARAFALYILEEKVHDSFGQYHNVYESFFFAVQQHQQQQLVCFGAQVYWFSEIKTFLNVCMCVFCHFSAIDRAWHYNREWRVLGVWYSVHT